MRKGFSKNRALRVLVFVCGAYFFISVFGPRRIQEDYFRMSDTPVNPFIYRETTSGSDICDGDTDIVVLVNSHYKNMDKRNAIRSTWGPHLKQGTWLHGQKLNRNIRLAFVFGQSLDPDEELGMQQESEREGDIIQANFTDTYRNITLKSLFAMKWMTQHCPSAKYLLKCDDDVIISFPAILDILDLSDTTNTIWGHLVASPRTQRWSKYWLSYSDYPFFYLPPYMKGYAYVISAGVIPSMVRTSDYVPWIPIDDAYITGFLTRILHINLSTKHAYNWGLFDATACDILTNTVLVGVYDKAQSMLDTWQDMKQIKSTELDCQNTILKFLKWFVYW